ncbi:MAG: membrane protein insertase YidC [Phycisphaerales bacterium]|nr:membrane protein insertase YidC [Phycisphaerales bacterium]
MPRPKNTLARVLVPLAVALIGVGAVVAVFKGSGAKPTPTPAPSPGQTPAPEVATQPPAPTPGPIQPATPPDAAPRADVVPEQPPVQGVSLGKLESLVWGDEPETRAFRGIGALTPGGPEKVRIEFSLTGAGIRSLTLADHFVSVLGETNYEIQSERSVPVEGGGPPPGITPFGLLGLEVTPAGGTAQFVPLAGNAARPVWREVAPGSFEAFVVGGEGRRVLRVERAYVLADNRYSFTLRQRVVNLTDTPLSVRLYELGPIDLEEEHGTYGGEKRKVRFGYLLPPNLDPTQRNVASTEFETTRADALGERGPNGYLPPASSFTTLNPGVRAPLWPSERSITERYQLAWTGVTNRYYGVAVYPVVHEQQPLTLANVGLVSRVVLQGPVDAHMALRLDGARVDIAPGATADLSHTVYAGPLDKRVIRADAGASVMGLTGLVVHNFGGMCGFCTFDSVTSLLLGLLHALHDYLFFDWAVAIVFLVVIVRTCLHPVTKWSQIRLARFGKQMSAIAPKQKELQEKFKDDPKKMQAETARLWREEGISPTGMLGCIPAFLQMPIWIALYATLFFAVELRHEAGFYGLFQSIQPKASPFWQFLGDLAEPDRFIYFGKTFEVPLLSAMIGPVSSVNVLPLLLGVVFFIQQKYLTPPTAATLTPEQEMQQKMVKWMMVGMFPLFMYNAPSGLAIYFICNSTLAIIESKWIRSHMDSKGLLDLDKMRAERAGKAANKASWAQRIQAMAEQRQRQAGQAKKPKR